MSRISRVLIVIVVGAAVGGGVGAVWAYPSGFTVWAAMVLAVIGTTASVGALIVAFVIGELASRFSWGERAGRLAVAVASVLSAASVVWVLLSTVPATTTATVQLTLLTFVVASLLAAIFCLPAAREEDSRRIPKQDGNSSR